MSHPTNPLLEAVTQWRHSQLGTVEDLEELDRILSEFHHSDTALALIAARVAEGDVPLHVAADIDQIIWEQDMVDVTREYVLIPDDDAGWVPAGLQIGLTGKVVAPDVYIAIGMSGSSQHMSGCSGSKTIVAINKDAEANIIKRARYAVVGDWKKVLPALIEKLKS